jgi:hypothetical protein
MTSPSPVTGEAAPVQVEERGNVPVVRTRPVLTADSHPSFPTAYADYRDRYGDFPNAHQFARFLADHHGIDDSGQPIPEKDLVPVVKALRRRVEGPRERAAERPEAASFPAGVSDPPVTRHPQRREMTDPVGHAVSVTATPQTPGAETVSAASTAEEREVGGRLPRQTPTKLTAGSVTGRTDGDAATWEATATDTGGATVQIPEQQVDETPVGELTEEQRIERVIQWLIEAEAEGKRLSGAEAARRHQVSPKTGQRDVIKAREILKGRQRERGRAHLRSVSSD